MGIELAKAFLRIRADRSQLDADLAATRGRVTRAMGAIKQAAASALGSLGLLGGGLMVLGGARVAAQFEDSMMSVRINANLLGEQGEASFNRLSAAVKEAGETTRFTASEAAGAMNELILGGLSAQQAIDSLGGTMDTAAATGMGLSDAAKTVVDNLAVFNLEASQAGRIGDVLVTSQRMAQTTAMEMAHALQVAGPVAGALGTSIEETSALLLGLAKTGVRGAEAGTALRMGFQRLLNPVAAVKDELNNLGIDMANFVDSSGKISDPIALFQALADAGITAQQALAIFGARGARLIGLLELMKRGQGTVQGFAAVLQNSLGAAEEAAAAREQTFIGRLKELLSAFQSLAINGIGPMLDALKPFVQLVTGAARVAAGWADRNAFLLSVLTTMAATVGVVLVGVKGLAVAYGLVTTAVVALTAAQVTFNTIWAASLGAIASAVATFVAAAAAAAALGYQIGMMLRPIVHGEDFLKTFNDELERFNELSAKGREVQAGIISQIAGWDDVSAEDKLARINSELQGQRDQVAVAEKALADYLEGKHFVKTSMVQMLEEDIEKARLAAKAGAEAAEPHIKALQAQIAAAEEMRRKQEENARLAQGPAAAAVVSLSDKIMQFGRVGVTAFSDVAGKGGAWVEAAQEAGDFTKQLQLQAATLGMSATEARLFALEQQRVPSVLLAGARAAQAEIDAFNKRKELMDRGKTITEQYRTANEKLVDSLKELTTLLAHGAIDFGTFGRAASDALKEKFGDAINTGIMGFIRFGSLSRAMITGLSAGTGKLGGLLAKAAGREPFFGAGRTGVASMGKALQDAVLGDKDKALREAKTTNVKLDKVIKGLDGTKDAILKSFGLGGLT